jgi:hypothetical protein
VVWLDARLEEQPDRDEADPTCQACRGTGFFATTTNPQGRWDAYSRIGPMTSVEGILADLTRYEGIFALLTPDGLWRDRGPDRYTPLRLVGKSWQVWMTELVAALRPLGRLPAVLVDCHA